MTVTLKKKRRKIWIALPCYGATVAVLTMKSLIHDMFRIVMRGDECYIFDQLGHADIYLLRAQIVSHFLSDPDATDLVMIDNDVGWQAEGLLDLLAHDVDLVAGSYPKRQDPITFMFRSEMDKGGALYGDPDTGLVEVWGMPGGFMRMRRGMLEKMAAHYADLNHLDNNVPSGTTCRMFDPYWIKTDTGNRVLAEDYAFCQRWRDIGGKVYMDASISMAHIGTKAYMGRLGDWIESTKKDEAEAA
jgi:hypothetical protein